MKAKVSVCPYKHASKAKFVVSWHTGKMRTRAEMAAWNAEFPDASASECERFRRANYRRHRRFFETKSEADSFAEQLAISQGNEWIRALDISAETRMQAKRAIDRLRPYGATIDDAVEHYVKYIEQSRRSRSIKDLVVEYVGVKQAKGYSERYLKDIRFRLGRFVDDFGSRIASTLSVAEIDDWLHGLRLSPQSVNNYRAVLRALFAYAERRDYAAENPVAKIEKVRLPNLPPEIFTPEELVRLLNEATDDLLAPLVIGAFAGLRQAEVFRLDWSEVDLARGFIEVTARKSKTAARRLVKIEPNLKEWLGPIARKSGPVWPYSEAMWRFRMKPIREAANLEKWPSNGLRHSFGSYHLAKYGNANALALEMGHTTTKEIFAHYREVVRPEEAERYWNIRPNREGAVVVEIDSAEEVAS